MENSRKIEPFKEWLNNKQKLNESEIAIQVEWWDDCIVQVLKQIEAECNGLLITDKIIEFIKKRNIILGRDYDINVGTCVVEHIKELIFHYHWQSLVGDEDDCYAGDNATMHSMGLAVESLAEEIYDRILEKSNPFEFSDLPITKLADKPVHNEPCDCADEDDDLPMLDVVEESRKVMPFKEYVKSVNESVAIIDCFEKDKCIESCLKRIKKEVGSFDPEALLLTALDALGGKVKARVISIYVNGMVQEYLDDLGVNMILPDEADEKNIPEDVVNQAVSVLCAQIADDVLYEICKENGVEYEEVSETYYREEPTTNSFPKDEKVERLEEFASNKDKRAEIIKAWTKIKEHPKAKDMDAEVGSAFEPEDLDEELEAAFEAIGDGGFIYCSYERTFWMRHKGQLIRVM